MSKRTSYQSSFVSSKRMAYQRPEDEIQEMYEDFKRFLKNYPNKTEIDVEAFRERFFKNEIGDPAKIYVFKFLIVILKLLPEIRKNRMKKIQNLIMTNEEDNLTGIFKLADLQTKETYYPITERKYFNLIKEYLAKIKEVYHVNTSSFTTYNGFYESQIPSSKRFFVFFISNTQVHQLIQSILNLQDLMRSSSRSKSASPK